MRRIILAAILASTVPLALSPADAQPRREVWREQRECERELRDADNRREYNRELRECRREVRRERREWRTHHYNRNYARPYYPENSYRDGRYYSERRLSRADRIYRGRDGRYYCERDDGTTGLIVGGAIGALIGNAVDDGRSSLLGTLIGGAAGAALGREVDRGELRCR